MSVKIINAQGTAYRPYRFPPKFTAKTVEFSQDPEAIQRALTDGFQEGSAKGFEQGLAQGIEAGYKEGLEKGHKEGFANGQELGYREGKTLFAEAAAPLNTIVAEYQQTIAQLDSQRRHELLELVKKVSQQVIRCELTLHPTQLLSLVEEALVNLPSSDGDIRVLLNPEECSRIRDIAPEAAEKWQLVPDDSLALGEVRVVTDQAEADVGCQQRLDACVEKLAEHLQLVVNQ
ncbi:MAG: flagellar assembly protein FliH [Cellvibrio sp.]